MDLSRGVESSGKRLEAKRLLGYRYLIKLNRELKVIRATFEEISAAVALHGAVDMSGLLKVVSTSTMPPEEVRKAMAAVEGDAATRLAGLMDERKRLQNEIQVRSDMACWCWLLAIVDRGGC